MTNFFAAFQSEVFRPLVSLLIPGALGLSPWFIFLIIRFPRLREIVYLNHVEASFVLLFATLLLGLMIEAQGTRLESFLDKRADARTEGQHMREWFAYLRTAFVADPIGRRYIRSLVLKLKFEFGVSIAMVLAVIGMLSLRWVSVSWRVLWPLIVLAIMISLLQLFEARATHNVLAKTRCEINKTITIVGGSARV